MKRQLELSLEMLLSVLIYSLGNDAVKYLCSLAADGPKLLEIQDSSLVGKLFDVCPEVFNRQDVFDHFPLAQFHELAMTGLNGQSKEKGEYLSKLVKITNQDVLVKILDGLDASTLCKMEGSVTNLYLLLKSYVENLNYNFSLDVQVVKVLVSKAPVDCLNKDKSYISESFLQSVYPYKLPFLLVLNKFHAKLTRELEIDYGYVLALGTRSDIDQVAFIRDAKDMCFRTSGYKTKLYSVLRFVRNLSKEATNLLLTSNTRCSRDTDVANHFIENNNVITKLDKFTLLQENKTPMRVYYTTQYAEMIEWKTIDISKVRSLISYFIYSEKTSKSQTIESWRYMVYKIKHSIFKSFNMENKQDKDRQLLIDVIFNEEYEKNRLEIEAVVKKNHDENFGSSITY